jgi:hypothetical protein
MCNPMYKTVSDYYAEIHLQSILYITEKQNIHYNSIAMHITGYRSSWKQTNNKINIF